MNDKNFADTPQVIYTTLELLEDLRQEIEQIAPTYIIIDGKRLKTFRGGKLSENRLGIFLGRKITYIKNNLKHQLRRNPHFIISLEVLEAYKKSLVGFFGEKSKNTIRFIDKYISVNNPVKSTKYQIFYTHREFKINHFRKIDTKEKAYWLGFLYADGWVTLEGGYKYRIGLQLAEEDRLQLEAFCKFLGLDHNKIEETISYLTNNGKTTEYPGVRIRFINSIMATDLMNLGLVERKSKIIELPSLGTEDLDLAFLLGFYDGEGWQGRTRFTCGSKKFVEQIKQKYRLPYKISRTSSGAWGMSLGARLFNDMIANYKYSLERKRKEFEVRRYKVSENFENLMTKGLLQKLVLEKPIINIADVYEVWHRDVTNLCSKWSIKVPSHGYWNQKRFLGDCNDK